METREFQFDLQNELRRELEKQTWVAAVRAQFVSICLLSSSAVASAAEAEIAAAAAVAVSVSSNVVIEGVIDPNEPVYCFCRKVSYGEMVACDNEQVLCECLWIASNHILAVPD